MVLGTRHARLRAEVRPEQHVHLDQNGERDEQQVEDEQQQPGAQRQHKPARQEHEERDEDHQQQRQQRILDAVAEQTHVGALTVGGRLLDDGLHEPRQTERQQDGQRGGADGVGHTDAVRAYKVGGEGQMVRNFECVKYGSNMGCFLFLFWAVQQTHAPGPEWHSAFCRSNVCVFDLDAMEMFARNSLEGWWEWVCVNVFRCDLIIYGQSNLCACNLVGGGGWV